MLPVPVPVPDNHQIAGRPKKEVKLTKYLAITTGTVVQAGTQTRWKTRWSQLIFVTMYNVLDFVFICAGFYCET